MVTYSESFLSFLKGSKCKIARTLYRAYQKDYPSYRLMLTTGEINYLTLRPDGNISYLPSGRESKTNDNGQWCRDGRQAGRPAKVIRKLFTEKAQRLFKDKDFECFANAYKSKLSDSCRFELWQNDQIPSAYDMSIAPGGGSLAYSCMNQRGEFMEIYVYCGHLRILVLLDEEERLCGRSLIWSLEDGITLMDRIYVVSDFMYDLFISYAADNGWWHKETYRSAENKELFINEKGEEVQKKFQVITSTEFDTYPYIDTFAYGHYGSLNNYGDGRYEYTDTDGSRSGDGWDAIEGCAIDLDNVITVTHGRYRGVNTHVDNTVEIDEEIWWVDDHDIEVVGGSYYHKDDTVLCDHDGERRLIADCIWSDALESYVLKTDSQTVQAEIDHSAALDEQQRA
jgi:hypothetical protein